MERLTFEELCGEAETTPDRLDQLIEIRVIRPADDGTFAVGDIQRSRTIAALEAAGITLDQIDIAVRNRWMDFTSLDLFYPPPARRSGRSYADFRAALGARGAHLGAIYAAFGLAEPDAEQRMRSDDEGALSAFLNAWDLAAGLEPDVVERLGIDVDEVTRRAARMPGEAMRRFAEGWISLFTETLSNPMSADEPSVDSLMPVIVPRARRTYVAAELVVEWLFRRHLEAALDALNTESTESGLAARGISAPRPAVPEAMAFIDLAGFTRLTEERGDASALWSATRLADLATDRARRHAGRLVKALGDGVMLHFDEAAAAILASLEIIDLVRIEGLPDAHVGIAAGPLIARDGDFFGHTVNLASRLSARAEGGRVLVNDLVVETAGGQTPEIAFLPAGELDLKGLDTPVMAWWADRRRT